MIKGPKYDEMVNVVSILGNMYDLIRERFEELSTSDVD